MKTNIYYYLPLDQFGQPDGNICEISLTYDQYREIKKQPLHPLYYCYEKYESAYNRALS